MQKGILFKQCDNLTVMESLPDKEYMMIYLDVPYYTGAGDLICEDGSNSIRAYLSKERKCDFANITIEEIAAKK